MQQIVEGSVFCSRTENSEKTYGIVFRTQGGNTVILSDVDPDYEVARSVAERLVGEQTDEEQLRYLAEDLLGTIYDGERT